MGNSMGPGVYGPNGYPIRRVDTRPQKVGRIWNNSGVFEMGKTKWAGDTPFTVEKPTGMNVGKSTTRGTGEG